MPRYADPSRCPDCAAGLPAAPGLCPTCGLPLTGPLAAELLRTLRRADDLVVQLRSSVSDLATAGVGAPATRGSAGSSDELLPPSPLTGSPGAAYPPPTEGSARSAPRRGLSAPSVPRILLGLGATCLLVAAVIFLAVAWSWIGIGGRTAVLVAATFATGILGVRLGRRDLRIGAEALTTVSLGLLVLDLAGAQNAGWLGELEGSAFAILVGAALASAGTALLACLERDQRRLVVPQIAAVLGAVVAMVAVHDLTDLVTVVLVIEILGCAAVVRAGLGHAVPFVVGGVASVGVLWWLVLGLYALSEAVSLDGGTSLRRLWVDGDGVALLAAVLLALVPMVVTPAHHLVRQASVAVATVVLTVALVLPVLDNGATESAAVWLGALVCWTLAAHLVRRPDAPAGAAAVAQGVLVPLGLAWLVGAAALTEFLGRAVVNVFGAGVVFAQDAAVRLDVVETRVHPALLLPFAAALLMAAYVMVPRRCATPQVAAITFAIASLATLAQYAVPLWIVVALLVVLGLAVLADSLRRAGAVGLAESAGAAVLFVAGALVALPSAALTAGALSAALVAAGGLLLLARTQARGGPAGLQVGPLVESAAGAVVPLAWAGVVWATAQASDVSLAWCAVVVMTAVGLLAIVLPRIEIEVTATLAVLLSAPASIDASADPSVALALHLTLAGVLVTATSLVHRERRPLSVLGGLLLAAATWVRLADLGVTAPEAYTLPLALVLLALGVAWIRRDATVSTSTALLSGLLLGTVPSLLWVLGDPVSLRALLLGLGCLGLLLGGAQARWSASLVVGAAVGAVLVLRELAPYAAQTPQWVAIGLAGTMLTVIGVTWEKRLQNVQQAGEYLARLR